ncbi:hypothetical protein ACQY0O_006737 [Thecaphora frezii]
MRIVPDQKRKERVPASSEIEKREKKAQIGLFFGFIGLAGNLGWNYIAWKSLQDNKRKFEAAKHRPPLPPLPQGEIYCSFGTATTRPRPDKVAQVCVKVPQPDEKAKRDGKMSKRSLAKAGERLGGFVNKVTGKAMQSLRGKASGRDIKVAGRVKEEEEEEEYLTPPGSPLHRPETEKEKKKKWITTENTALALGIINSLGSIPSLIMTFVNTDKYRGNPKVD